ncbi:MAG TPA: TetR family transcriptional regulator [Salinisphaeraceae bacterium]|nr:TetR family transcriptional regulator [Salinisphaeraceae bacterium]
MARKTKTRAAQTRSAILDAAEREMQARGVSGASFERIAQRASVTRGAIYWHFADKDALLTAMVERTYLPLRDLQYSLRNELPHQEAPAILRAMLLHGLERLASDAHHRRVCHILTHGYENTDPDHPVAVLMRNAFEESRVVVHDLCQQAADADQLQPQVTVDNACDLVMAFMCGVYSCSLRYNELFTVQRDWRPMVATLLSGLFVAGEE